MTIIEQAQKIRESINGINYTASPAQILTLPAGAVDEWTPGRKYTAGQLTNWNGIKYLIIPPIVTAQAHQPPDMPDGAMLSVYKPFRDSGRYPWLYGEYCLKGYERQHNGKWYKVIQTDAGANIYTPDQVPAVWEEM